MASELPWKVDILQRLQNRDRQEFVSFKDLIKSRMSIFIYYLLFYVQSKFNKLQTLAFLFVPSGVCEPMKNKLMSGCHSSLLSVILGL